MNAFSVMAVQSTLSLIVFALLGAWHVAPRLSKTSLEDALMPLTWVHVFRFLPLSLFVPGQASPSLPADVARTIAYGDLVSAIAALVTLVFLRIRLPGARGVAWLFNLVGLADVALGGYSAIGAKLYEIPIGFSWYIVNVYVPLLVVTHVMMIALLLRRR